MAGHVEILERMEIPQVLEIMEIVESVEIAESIESMEIVEIVDMCPRRARGMPSVAENRKIFLHKYAGKK